MTYRQDPPDTLTEGMVRLSHEVTSARWQTDSLVDMWARPPTLMDALQGNQQIARYTNGIRQRLDRAEELIGQIRQFLPEKEPAHA